MAMFRTYVNNKVSV